ncbi:Uncharacterized protein HZ326_30190 [Fusarium oxysporum f. sp. albedinis]|nr:Uncharacterized protein HZ326_30190 [Fusarium oxysporum f. sp. albedinis]
MDQRKTSELNTEKNKRLLSRYGIVPSRRTLLRHYLELSSDIGAVTTGSEHPIRLDISVASCLVPSSNNLDENANQHLSDENKTGELEFTAHSHLQQETEAQRENEPRETKQQHNV